MGFRMFSTRVLCMVSVLLLGAVTAVRAQPAPDYDFQWATVGSPGNAPYNGTLGTLQGHGGVGYEYRMSRLEVTTSQWMEFVNTFSTQGLNPAFVSSPPIFWGAVRDFNYPGPGVRYRLSSSPDSDRFPVGGISWRSAAMFCNWLESGKSPAFSAIQNGAYDTSTFGRNPDGSFTDQLTHSPGAHFWIPTIDEAIKASHFDPDRYGPGQPGYWENKNRSDGPTPSGPPGVGQTTGGWIDPVNSFGEMRVPLGSYPAVVSPWGLWDTSGATTELTEYLDPQFPPYFARGVFGSSAGDLGHEYSDRVLIGFSDYPDEVSSRVGLRIASSIPSPSSCAVFAAVGFAATSKSRRRTR